MNIAIDTSPLSSGHRVRGVGFYLENLKRGLLSYDSKNSYQFFIKNSEIPRNADVIHYPYFDPFRSNLPFLKQKKIVVTVHDLIPILFPKNFPPGIRGKIRWELQKKLLKRIDAIVTDSYSSKKDIERLIKVPAKKIHVVYLAAGEEFRKISNVKYQMSNIKKKYGLPEKFALYVGDVTWNKNLPRLVEAAISINIPLVMVGKALTEKEFDRKSTWNHDLVKVKELSYKNNLIHLLGFIPREDLVTLYNSATIFTMPSRYEGFGLPILEAMSCGCPVLTSQEGSLGEVAGEAAFFADAKSIRSIAEGMQKLWNENSLRESLSKKGLIQAKKFSWKKTALQTAAIYRSVFTK